jgi:hypothetical protein
MHVYGFPGVEFTYACVCTHVRTSGSDNHGRAVIRAGRHYRFLSSAIHGAVHDTLGIRGC